LTTHREGVTVITMSITRHSVVQRNPDALAADVGGEVVLMSVEQAKYYGLDEVGSAIWHRLESPIDVGQLCAALAQVYDADNATIERDVIALLNDMQAHDLLAPGPATEQSGSP
jgi:hypothetical protein